MCVELRKLVEGLSHLSKVPVKSTVPDGEPMATFFVPSIVFSIFPPTMNELVTISEPPISQDPAEIASALILPASRRSTFRAAAARSARWTPPRRL